MTRSEDDKMGNQDLPPGGYDAKVEDRYTKDAKAKQQQGGRKSGAPPKLNNTHADDGGEHKF